MLRLILLSLTALCYSYGVTIAYDNTLTPDPGLAVTTFGPNSTPDPVSGLVIDLLGDQIQLDLTAGVIGGEARTSVYNLGDDFSGVLRLYLYSASGPLSLLGTFDSTVTIPTSGATGTVVTWDLGGLLMTQDMVWLVGVESDSSAGLPVLSLEHFIAPQVVGLSSDAFYYWQLATQTPVAASSGLGNDSFYFQVTTVPEPSTWLLFSSALGAALVIRRRRAVAKPSFGSARSATPGQAA